MVTRDHKFPKKKNLLTRCVRLLASLFLLSAILSVVGGFFLLWDFHEENMVLKQYLNEALPNEGQNYGIDEKIRRVYDWTRNRVVIRKHDNRANFGLRMTPVQTLETGGLCSDYARVFITLAHLAGLDCTRLYLYRNSAVLDKQNNPSYHVVPVVRDENGFWICPDIFAGGVYLYSARRLVNHDTLTKPEVWQDVPAGKYLDSYGLKFNWVKIPVIFPAAYKILSRYESNWIETARLPYFTERPNLFGAILLFIYSGCILIFGSLLYRLVGRLTR